MMTRGRWTGWGRATVLAGCVTGVFAGTAMAESAPGSLPAPSGAVILTVHGDIARTNGNAEAALDKAMIEAIGVVTMHTGTIWTDGTSEFQGVELARLLAHLGADGRTLRLTALNDYAVEIPVSEAVDGGPMLAFRMDGKDLSPRDKGPLWMIYPYDVNSAYKNEVSYSRSIWQLTRIEVLD
ncbi:MAG: molybdopterin-dependent oxidoreductase [Pseudotabrizicola sp.]|uniref:molybdopterin-dependent oxidoreductase n=1 Tax=Pseudotabrizicola sp. TaxID=2939647 RepID=UPI0027282976|nr:molybdopterin-dependent oxidoreductase [Pseudotabrizicola sp.]MDO9637891.1 molybdopterin-dependent oxidoreductase [Pseudotabrizicola sp.]